MIVLYGFSNIRAVPMGLSKTVKKLVGAKVPDMSQYNDISEFIDRFVFFFDCCKSLNTAINTAFSTVETFIKYKH